MACNPHFNQPVSEKQVYQSSVRKVVEIVADSAKKPAQKS